MLWVAVEVTESQQRAEQEALFPLGPLLNKYHNAATWVAPSWRQKNMVQMKEQTKAPEKIQLSNEEIDNISDAEFKTLVIRMLTELIELGRKIEEDMKALQSEIKENMQGTNSNRKGTRTQINGLEQKEEINFQPEQNEEIRIQKK